MENDIKIAGSIMETESRKANERTARMQAEMESFGVDARASGILQKIEYDNAHSELVKYAVLYQVRKDKEYRKTGKTWEEFCESNGMNVRNTNRILSDLKPIYDNFQAKLSQIAGVPLNKIRYLGKSIQDKMTCFDENDLIIDGARIPLLPENKGDIEAFIDQLKETHRREKETLETRVKKAEKKVDDQVAAKTENLQAQLDAMVKENKRLEAFEPVKVDIETYEKQMKDIQDLAIKLNTAVQKFMSSRCDEIREDVPAQARIESYQDLAYKSLAMLRREWDTEIAVSLD